METQGSQDFSDEALIKVRNKKGMENLRNGSDAVRTNVPDLAMNKPRFQNLEVLVL